MDLFGRILCRVYYESGYSDLEDSLLLHITDVFKADFAQNFGGT